VLSNKLTELIDERGKLGSFDGKKIFDYVLVPARSGDFEEMGNAYTEVLYITGAKCRFAIVFMKN
jgi:hypothetical protein